MTGLSETSLKESIIIPGNNLIIEDGGMSKLKLLIENLKENKITQFKIITPYNKNIEDINIICQKIFTGRNISIKDSLGRKWNVGDSVIMTKNNYDINVMNGEEGIITKIENEGIYIMFNDEEIRFEKKCLSIITNNETINSDKSNKKKSETLIINDMSSIELCYAISIHRSQGSEWENVILYIPESEENDFLNRNMLYTAATRASFTLICMGNDILDTIKKMAMRKSQVSEDYLHIRINNLLES